MKKLVLLISLTTILEQAYAQNVYKYSVDLTRVTNDELEIVLETPGVKESTILFHMPKIIPGTYKIADYGQFVSKFMAFDKKGKALRTNKENDNTWRIQNASKIDRITYTIEDSWDSKAKVKVYSMAGTNIEENKNFVINTPGFFGYFEGMRNIPFELSITKPALFIMKGH